MWDRTGLIKSNFECCRSRIYCESFARDELLSASSWSVRCWCWDCGQAGNWISRRVVTSSLVPWWWSSVGTGKWLQTLSLWHRSYQWTNVCWTETVFTAVSSFSAVRIALYIHVDFMWLFVKPVMLLQTYQLCFYGQAEESVESARVCCSCPSWCCTFFSTARKNPSFFLGEEIW